MFPSFLSLPAELRVRIYSMLLRVTGAIDVSEIRTGVCGKLTAGHRTPAHLGFHEKREETSH
jgi:hypothetical protein